MRSYRRMIFADRQKIAVLYENNERVEAIANELGYNRASVYDELKRGFTGEMDKNGRSLRRRGGKLLRFD